MARQKGYITIKVVNVGKDDASRITSGRVTNGHLPIGTTLTLEVGSDQEKHLLANGAIRASTQEVPETAAPVLKDPALEGIEDLKKEELLELAARKNIVIPDEMKKKDDIRDFIVKTITEAATGEESED